MLRDLRKRFSDGGREEAEGEKEERGKWSVREAAACGEYTTVK